MLGGADPLEKLERVADEGDSYGVHSLSIFERIRRLRAFGRSDPVANSGDVAERLDEGENRTPAIGRLPNASTLDRPNLAPVDREDSLGEHIETNRHCIVGLAGHCLDGKVQ